MSRRAADRHRSAPPGVDALQQAGEWFARLQDESVSAEDHAAWRRWLHAHPENRRAWERIDAVARRFRCLRQGAGADAARGTLETLRGRRTSRRRALGQLCLLAGVGAAGYATWRHTALPGLARAWSADHRTGVGEIAELALADGTRLWLDTDSAVNLDYRPDRRHLRLLRGGILVRTAPDPDRRPFIVHTSHGRVQALGTRFVVRLAGAWTRVGVEAGAVAIEPVAGARGVLPAGRQTRFTPDTVAPSTPADAAAAAWTRGEIVADHRPLGELLAELARYRHGWLTVAPEVAELPVMGVYPVTDTERALAMLERALPVRVRRPLPLWATVQPR